VSMPWDDISNGRAWEDYQKKLIVDRLLELWVTHPGLRLGQLIRNVYDDDRLFTEEDWPFIERLEEVYRGYGRGADPRT
jgi:hypothetical protein